MSWSVNQVERLAKLVNAGKTSGDIAHELGVTRNTVMGKITRLGLKLASSSNRKSEPVEVKKRETKKRVTKVKRVPLPIKFVIPEASPLASFSFKPPASAGNRADVAAVAWSAVIPNWPASWLTIPPPPAESIVSSMFMLVFLSPLSA